jgi:NAD(P)-dependent dehydrogenase (short-subunit alcohol dehydrogenase family)
MTEPVPHSADPNPAPPGPPPIAGIPHEARRAIVVGASSGIGAALVRQLAREGYSVAALARRADKLEELKQACAADGAQLGGGAQPGGRVICQVHDTRDADEVGPLFERLVRELGGLDLLIYPAGIMPKVERDQYDTKLDLDMLAVNFGGCVAWCNPTATLFQTQRSGTIIGVSSIAGDRGRKGNPMYGATKAAMNHYLEALRNRLAEYGVHVCTIKPGYVDTRMTQGMEKLFWLITPEQAAAQILGAARNRVNVRYVPLRWGVVGTTIRLIPSFVFRKLSF